MQHIGPNTKGIAALTMKGPRPVIIEYIDEAVGFYHVRDLETHEPYTIFRTSFSMPPQIPSRFREEAFKRVVSHWALALNSYPAPVEIDPSPLARLSFMRLLRDAREAKNTYGWVHPSIDERLWTELASQITITETANGVTMGTRAAKFPATSEPVGKAITPEPPAIEFQWQDAKDLDALCLLLDHKTMTNQPAFHVENLTPVLIESLESRYNVAICPLENNENKWIII